MLLPHHYIHTILHIRRRNFENHTPHPPLFPATGSLPLNTARPPVNGTLTSEAHGVLFFTRQGGGVVVFPQFSITPFRATHPTHAV